MSNFTQKNLEELLSFAKIPPAVNQIELHPYLTQKSLIAYCQQRNIHVRHLIDYPRLINAHSLFKVTAYSPFAQGKAIRGKGVLQEEVVEKNITTLPSLTHSWIQILRVAEKHHKTSSQIILRWLLQCKVSVVPKSTKPVHMAENLDVFDFTLSEEDMSTIDSLNCDRRYMAGWVEDQWA